MWTTVGQEHLLNQISASLHTGGLSHSYLLTGPPHSGKMTLALDMTAAVICKSPDAHDQSPCGHCQPCTRIRKNVYSDLRMVVAGDDPGTPTRISIQQIRNLENFLSVTPVEGTWKIVILDGAETLAAGQQESANALLKTLEEPPDHVLIILLTTHPEAVQPTIRSRCHVLALHTMPGTELNQYLTEHHSATPDKARLLTKLSQGCPGWAISALTTPGFLENYESALKNVAETSRKPLEQRFNYAAQLAELFTNDRKSVQQTLYLWQSWWRDVMFIQQDVSHHVQNINHLEQLAKTAESTSTTEIVAFLRQVQQTLQALDQNARPRLALECLMLAVPPT